MIVYTEFLSISHLLLPPSLYVADFRGRIPMEPRSLSSEKSYSPSMLMCAQATGEFVGQLDLVELFFYCLTEFEVVYVAQDEQRFDDLAEGFECLV